MVEKRKSRINSGVVIAFLLVVATVAQAILLCAKMLFGSAISWFAALIPSITVGCSVLAVVLCFVVGVLISSRKEKRMR